MSKADQIKAGMNARQQYRCKMAELRAYNFSGMTFREWVDRGRPCVVHESWKPGQDFRFRSTSGTWGYTQRRTGR